MAPARRRRRWPWATGLLVAPLVAGAAVAGFAAYNAGSEGGSPPATTTSPAPVTTLAPPTTLPPPTAPPTTLPPPDNRGEGDGGGVDKQFRKWLEQLRKQFEEAQTGG